MPSDTESALVDRSAAALPPAHAAALGVAAIAATLAMRWPWLRFPIGYDESVWAYIAQQTLRGGFLPYRDVIDNKPPLVYVPFFLSELFAGHGDAAVRATGVALHVLISGLLVYVLARALGPAAAIAAGAAEAVLGGTPHLEGDYLLQSEVQIEVVLVLLLWAVCRAADRPAGAERAPGLAAALGGLCAAAFLTKQTHVVLAPAFLVLAISTASPGRRTRDAALFASGFALLVALVVLPFALAGALPHLAHGVFGHNLRHVVALPTAAHLAEQIRSVFSNQALLAFLGLAGGALALFVARTRVAAAVAWTFFAAGALGVAAGGDRLFRHYFLLVSFPLHLLLACGIAALPLRGRWVAAAGVVALVALRIPAERRWPAEILRITPAPIDPRPLAFLARARRAGEGVFFEWQANYYETGIRAPHRYLSIEHFATPGYESERDEVLRVLASGRVDWIVTKDGVTPRDWGLGRILSAGWVRVFEWPGGAVYRKIRSTSRPAP